VVDDVLEDAALVGRDPEAAFGPVRYVGAPVVVDGEVYGTVCFYDTEPRADGIGEWDRTLVDMLCRWIGTARDRQRTTERLREQNERLEEFASIVSHDLHNPLNVLDGSLDLAEETGDPEHFERGRRAVDRMETLIEGLLALARGQEADTERLALAGLAERCWETTETGDASLRIETDTPISGDEKQLRRLLENLFRNSVEHGPVNPQSGDAEGENRAVTVTVGDLTDGFYVEDDGTGISPEDREQVFERGYSTERGGTGLGLRIVDRVAEAHGWDVALTEGPTGGARFEFTGVDR
jgi:signal transduction histidine kinase